MVERPKQRRALTQARRPARIATSGDRAAAEVLSRAIDVAGVAETQERDYTHGFHTYPARLHPLTARRALALLGPRRGELVLDPFCGSGTVLVEAMLLGARGVGIDANPIAVLVARAKTWSAPAPRRGLFVDRARQLAGRVIEEGKAARRSGYVAPRVPGGPALDAFFAPHVRREVGLLAALVGEERDPELRELFWAVLSSILVKVSKRASDTAGGRVERRVARGFAARLFADRAIELAEGLDRLLRQAPLTTPRPEALIGDARALPAGIAPGSVAAIVSSPPYAGTYDYLEHHAMRLAVLGIDAAGFAAAEIGARRGFGADVRSAVAAWERDFGRALGEMARVLRPGGRAVLITGDSLGGRGLSAQPVFSDDLLVRLAPRARLDIVATASIERAPLGTAELRAFQHRPKREHLILLARS